MGGKHAKRQVWYFGPSRVDGSRELRELLGDKGANLAEMVRLGLPVRQDGVRRSIVDLLRLPGVDVGRLGAIWPDLHDWSADVTAAVEAEAHYAGYMDRQDADVRAFREDEALRLPADLDFARVGGLSVEMRERLTAHSPATLGAAARIPGVTPAALTALLRHVRRRSEEQVA